MDLGKPVKQQILVNLQALKTAGSISSIVSLDTSVNPFENAIDSYPVAIVGAPRLTSDFEDQATNMVTYRFDILFAADPTQFKNADTDLEDLMDAAYSQFASANALTLSGAAVAAVLAPEVMAGPVSAGDKKLVCFVLTIQARTLFQTS
jgi:hypothetical protein